MQFFYKFIFVFIFVNFVKCDSESNSDEISSTTNVPVSTKDVPDFSIPCKIPTFVKILPVSYRRQLKKIWSGIPLNADCGPQLAATRELINNLPMNLKLKIAEYGEFEDKFRANFFSELLPEEKIEFGEILKNLSMNAIEKAETLREWGRDRLSLAAFENFEEYLNVFLERDRKFQEKLKKLSPEAKEAYDRIQDIRKEKQIVMSNLSEKAKKELTVLFKNECSIHHRTNLSRIQWDPVGVKKDEQNDRESYFGCYGLDEIGSNLAPNYGLLTKSYGREPPSTTPFLIPKIRSPINSYSQQQTNHFASTGSKLFQLLLQRVQYLKPLLKN